MKKLVAEFLGTFALVLFGCGAAVISGEAIGQGGISLAFGLSVLVMIYAVGGISGGHFNPAVSVGLAVAGRFSWKDVVPYAFAQVLGATSAAGILYMLYTGAISPDVGGFAANTYGSLGVGALAEIVMTFVFLTVILGATSKGAAAGFAGVAIGLTLTAVHLVSIPLTNTSVNPARSISQAIFSADPAAMCQLWLFIAAPIAGAVIAALVWGFCFSQKSEKSGS